MEPTYYDILDLRRDQFPKSNEHLKKAYRQALLQHHPDKKTSAGAQKPAIRNVSIDEIALAYKTLSEPSLKAEYDRLLITNDGENGAVQRSLHTGLETVDLDDLTFDDKAEVWSRACRCGVGGFEVSEAELEQNLEDREIIVGCKGCSLWLRVLFSVEE